MYLLPHLELSLPYEENVFIEATFFHYDLILIRFDRRHDIGKLIFCAYFWPAFMIEEVEISKESYFIIN